MSKNIDCDCFCCYYLLLLFVVVAGDGDGIVIAVVVVIVVAAAVVADHQLICIFTRYNCSSCNFHSSCCKNKWLSSLYLEINRKS